MIKSEIIKLKVLLDNTEIEKELKKSGIEPLRWAVTGIEDNMILVSVSYEC